MKMALKTDYIGTKPIKEIKVKPGKPVIFHSIEVYGKGPHDYTEQIYRIIVDEG